MNKKIKAKWIEALRSGKYKQTKEVLHDGDGFCCLGVLCEVLGIPKYYGEESGRWWFYSNNRREYEVLPADIAKDMGLTVDGALAEPVAFAGAELNDLAHLNDRGADFIFIADVIEKQL